MPLRQSRLTFGSESSRKSIVSPSLVPSSGEPESTMTTKPTEVDADTIIVDINEQNRQLPTPSESATDVSSQSSQTGEPNSAVRSRSKRVSRARASRFREENVDSVIVFEENSRSISGETLVTHSVSQSSLVQQGVKALDLPWNMSDVFVAGKKEDVALQNDETETGSVITFREGEDEQSTGEEDEERERQRAMKKAKMEENAKKWEERKKNAEKNASRRSNRASLFSKATDMISDLASSVLGKRNRDEAEKGKVDVGGIRTKIDTIDSDGKHEHKRQRTEQEPCDKEQTISKKRSTGKREKKWLTSGLYAGQVRTFDARLTETKNKKKTVQVEAPVKENIVIPLPMFAGERLLKQGRDFKLPFDVFSPLPAGQPKPDEWRKTNKNVFVGDAADEWRESKFVEHSTCLCQPETGCDQDCMNRYMYYECDDKNCRLTGTQCGNRAFGGLKTRVRIGGKYNVGVEVIKTVDRGYGVRSNRTFDPNQIIVEYTGEIINQEECEHRMHTMYKDNECYYLMLFDQNMIIDATRGSIARFVNHSCEPNCRMEKWTVGGKPRMALFAGDRGIMTGEELTYDYNFDPYSQKNVQACHCGAANCRGFLGPKPKEVKRSSPDDTDVSNTKKSEGRLTGAKRKVAEVLEESTNRLNKKRKINTGSVSKPSKVLIKKKQPQSRSPTKVKVVKKITSKKVIILKSPSKKLARSNSKLKSIVASVKNRTGQRIVSTGSARETLLGKEETILVKTAGVARASSLKEKASTLKKNMVKSVRARSKSMNVLV